MAESRQQVAESPESAFRPLSCVSCRARKVRCNRVSPCDQCLRSGLECAFPKRKRNRRPRQTRQNELLDRLSRLETIVGKVDPSALKKLNKAHEAVWPSISPPPGRPETFSPISSAGVAEEPRSSDAAVGQSRQQSSEADDPTNQYLSPHFWNQLCSEVEGLKQVLGHQSDSDDDEHPDESSPSSLAQSDLAAQASSYALFGDPASAVQERMEHPAPQHIVYLCSAYFSGVDTVIKILHRPTFTKLVDSFAISSKTMSLDRGTESLFFAMYYAAVISLSPEMCLADLGETRTALLERYRVATEMALARADYLNCSQIEPLQTFTLYIGCLRSQNRRRASWALMSLVIRLGQALGLHRDADGSAFTPFVAEMRRRLWWAMVVLDVRAVEDRGTEAILSYDGINTQLPTNINDDDFGPTSGPFSDRQGPTDISFNLCTAMASQFHLRIIDILSSGRPATASGDGTGPATAVLSVQTETEIIEHVQKLEKRFIEGADMTHTPSVIAARTVRLIILKIWLSMQYPVRVLPSRVGRAAVAGRPRVSHEDMLRTAVSVIELAEYNGRAPDAVRFRWWYETYIQWHPLAVALAELCNQTRGPLVERAWRVIDRVFAWWSEHVADSKTGQLWRPIRKLLRKAKEARAQALMGALAIDSHDSSSASVATSSPAASAAAGISTTRDVDVPMETASPGPAETARPDPMQQPRQRQPALAVSSPPNPAASNPDVLPWSTPDFFQGIFHPTPMNLDLGAQQPPTTSPSIDWTNWNEFVNDAYAEGGFSVDNYL